jgi:hypothetical protein
MCAWFNQVHYITMLNLSYIRDTFHVLDWLAVFGGVLLVQDMRNSDYYCNNEILFLWHKHKRCLSYPMALYGC